MIELLTLVECKGMPDGACVLLDGDEVLHAGLLVDLQSNTPSHASHELLLLLSPADLRSYRHAAARSGMH